MVCPVCPAVGMVGGYVGGYFGVNAPEQTELQIVGGLVTATLIVITVVALRCLTGLSLCDGNGDFSLRNIAQVGTIALVLGVIYSIFVNYLINLLFPKPSTDHNPFPVSSFLLGPIQDEAAPKVYEAAPHPCCCKKLELDTSQISTLRSPACSI